MSQADRTAIISPRFASVSAAVPSSSAVSGERAAVIAARVERVSELAQCHFDKHRQLWTNRQYGALLAQEGARMTLRPHGMPDDRKAHLARAADAMVLYRQTRRMHRIERAADNILQHGQRGRSHDVGR